MLARFLLCTLLSGVAAEGNFPLPLSKKDNNALQHQAEGRKTTEEQSKEHMEFLTLVEDQELRIFGDDCGSQSNCLDCTATRSHFGKPCRWCPLTEGNLCYSYGENAGAKRFQKQLNSLLALLTPFHSLLRSSPRSSLRSL